MCETTEGETRNTDTDVSDYWRWKMKYWQWCERLFKMIQVLLSMLFWDTAEDDTYVIDNVERLLKVIL